MRVPLRGYCTKYDDTTAACRLREFDMPKNTECGAGGKGVRCPQVQYGAVRVAAMGMMGKKRWA
jgi:hypothetical protein